MYSRASKGLGICTYHTTITENSRTFFGRCVCHLSCFVRGVQFDTRNTECFESINQEVFGRLKSPIHNENVP